MFCENCGRKISDNAKFCTHCGAPQNPRPAQNTQPASSNEETQQTANPQPVYTAPDPQKSKSDLLFRIIVVAIIAVSAFAIKYFVTQANQPIPFSTSNGYYFYDEEPAEKELPVTQPLKSKMFHLYDDFGSSFIAFNYNSSGVVAEIIGSVRITDKTVTSIDDLKSKAENATARLEQLGEVASFIDISDDPDSTRYSEDFVFGSLDSDTNLAELAAEFVGLETDDGKIDIYSAEAVMRDLGYILL